MRSAARLPRTSCLHRRARRQGPAAGLRRRRPRGRSDPRLEDVRRPGQVCLGRGPACSSRSSVADGFRDRFNAKVDAHVPGDPAPARSHALAADPPRAPLASRRGLRRPRPRGGDRIVRGGRRAASRRSRRPVLRAEPWSSPHRTNRRIVQREVLRPGLDLCQTFLGRGGGDRARQLTERRAVSAIVCTSSASRAERVGRAIRAGTTWVNAFLVRDLTAPFGGIGISGIGREGGDYALDFYSDLRTLQIAEGTTPSASRPGERSAEDQLHRPLEVAARQRLGGIGVALLIASAIAVRCGRRPGPSDRAGSHKASPRSGRSRRAP